MFFFLRVFVCTVYLCPQPAREGREGRVTEREGKGKGSCIAIRPEPTLPAWFSMVSLSVSSSHSLTCAPACIIGSSHLDTQKVRYPPIFIWSCHGTRAFYHVSPFCHFVSLSLALPLPLHYHSNYPLVVPPSPAQFRTCRELAAHAVAEPVTPIRGLSVFHLPPIYTYIPQYYSVCSPEYLPTCFLPLSIPSYLPYPPSPAWRTIPTPPSPCLSFPLFFYQKKGTRHPFAALSISHSRIQSCLYLFRLDQGAYSDTRASVILQIPSLASLARLAARASH